MAFLHANPAPWLTIPVIMGSSTSHVCCSWWGLFESSAKWWSSIPEDWNPAYMAIVAFVFLISDAHAHRCDLSRCHFFFKLQVSAGDWFMNWSPDRCFLAFLKTRKSFAHARSCVVKDFWTGIFMCSGLWLRSRKLELRMVDRPTWRVYRPVEVHWSSASCSASFFSNGLSGLILIDGQWEGTSRKHVKVVNSGPYIIIVDTQFDSF